MLYCVVLYCIVFTHAVVRVAVGVHVLRVSVESQRPGDLPRDDASVPEDANLVGCVAMTQTLPIKFVHVEDVIVRSTWLFLIAGFEICEFCEIFVEKMRLPCCVYVRDNTDLKLVNLARMLP